jgi:hypothetical protein
VEGINGILKNKENRINEAAGKIIGKE